MDQRYVTLPITQVIKVEGILASATLVYKCRNTRRSFYPKILKYRLQTLRVSVAHVTQVHFGYD